MITALPNESIERLDKLVDDMARAVKQRRVKALVVVAQSDDGTWDTAWEGLASLEEKIGALEIGKHLILAECTDG